MREIRRDQGASQYRNIFKPYILYEIMETRYHSSERLMNISHIIEDAAYEVEPSLEEESMLYVVGNSKCGSKCSSRSSRSVARGKSIVGKVKE